MEPAFEWSNWMLPQAEGIFLLNPQYTEDPPHSITLGDMTLHRFVDSIYVPCRLEDLTPSQVTVVNSLRLRLVAGGYMSDVHAAVKDVFERALKSAPQSLIVEWGCGFDPMNLRVPLASRYIGVDLDPSVVEFQRRLRVEVYEPTDPKLRESYRSNVATIISIFVFQFAITPSDVQTMKELLAPGGSILANVYRRDEHSRMELERLFNEHGFAVARTPDPQRLCAGHEYWLLGVNRSVAELMDVLVRLLGLTGHPSPSANVPR